MVTLCSELSAGGKQGNDDCDHVGKRVSGVLILSLMAWQQLGSAVLEQTQFISVESLVNLCKSFMLNSALVNVDTPISTLDQ